MCHNKDGKQMLTLRMENRARGEKKKAPSSGNCWTLSLNDGNSGSIHSGWSHNRNGNFIAFISLFISCSPEKFRRWKTFCIITVCLLVAKLGSKATNKNQLMKFCNRWWVEIGQKSSLTRVRAPITGLHHAMLTRGWVGDLASNCWKLFIQISLSRSCRSGAVGGGIEWH